VKELKMNNDLNSFDIFDNSFDEIDNSMVFSAEQRQVVLLSDEEVQRELRLALNLPTDERVKKLHNELPQRTNYTSRELDSMFWKFVEEEMSARVEDVKNANSRVQAGVLKANLLQWLIPFVNSVKEAEAIVKEKLASISDTPKFFTVGELLRLRANEKTSYIVKGLIPLGSLLLWVAPPKIGKSLMATQFAMAVAYSLLCNKSGLFLGRQIDSGNVLIIQNEENVVTTTASRIYTHGLQNLERDDPAMFSEMINSSRLTVAKGLDIIEDRDLIVEYVNNNNIKLVVVDSLSASIRKSGLTEYNPETAAAVHQLQNKCHEHNFTVILIHHATKLDDNSDKFNALKGIGGTSALSRFNDGIAKLMQTPKQPDCITLVTIPRQETPVSMVLRFTRDEAGYWYFELVEDTTMLASDLELQNQIVRLLLQRWVEWQELNDASVPVYGYSLRQLMKLTSRGRSDLVRVLNSMCDVEGIFYYPDQQQKVYIYHVQKSGECWLTCYFNYSNGEISADKKKLLALAEVDGEQAVKMLMSLNEKERQLVWSALDAKEKYVVFRHVKKPNYSIGDRLGDAVISGVLYYEDKGYFYEVKYPDNTKETIEEIDVTKQIPGSDSSGGNFN
jgi:hypothetical protein